MENYITHIDARPATLHGAGPPEGEAEDDEELAVRGYVIPEVRELTIAPAANVDDGDW